MSEIEVPVSTVPVLPSIEPNVSLAEAAEIETSFTTIALKETSSKSTACPALERMMLMILISFSPIEILSSALTLTVMATPSLGVMVAPCSVE